MPQQDNLMQKTPNPVHDGKPYFMGDHALIKFSGGEEGFGPETYWLVDKSNHTIRPFESEMALDAAFGEGVKDALQGAITVVPPAIDQDGNIHDGVLADFSILGPDYAIKEDGTSKHLHFSPHQLKGRYGKAINEDHESMATKAVDNFLDRIKKNEARTHIPASYIVHLKNDHQLMAFYISAMAYGEYHLNDILADITRRYHQSKK